MLKRLSDNELLTSVKNLIKKEKEVLMQIIEHLKEIEERRLYSDLKYESIFYYCVNELGYSAPQAYRRIDAMRTLKKMPELEDNVNDGSLSLTNINQVNSFFGAANIKDVKQQKNILLGFTNLTKKEGEQKINEMKEEMGISRKPIKTITKNINNDDVRLHLTLKKETLEKLKKVKGSKDWDTALNKLIDAHLEEKTTVKRKREVKEKVSRSIPKTVKSEVYKRANGKCENCGSIYNLEYDHKKPHAKGGTNGISNIRLLCKTCNQRAAIKEFGQAKMDFFINNINNINNSTSPAKKNMVGAGSGSGSGSGTGKQVVH